MTWLLYAVLALLALLIVPYIVLWFRYIVAINFERGGWWNLLVPLAIKTGALDIALNYTTFRWLMNSKPEPGERTISKHLERLVLLQTNKGAFCRYISKYFINPWDKVGGPHIPNVD
jgi:hypothetical protein